MCGCAGNNTSSNSPKGGCGPMCGCADNITFSNSPKSGCVSFQSSENLVGFDPHLQGIFDPCCGSSSSSCLMAKTSNERENITDSGDSGESMNIIKFCGIQALPFEGNNTCILTYDTGAS